MAANTIYDLIGRVFGRLTVTAEISRVDRNGHTRRTWLCRCTCGRETAATTGNLTHGNTQSCGCLRQEIREQRKYYHRTLPQREIRIWDNMIQRCTNPKNNRFGDYGGRGITVSQRWRTFLFFLSDMGPCPPGHTLDRIDNDGPYTGPCDGYPLGNCRWATPSEQCRNKRGNVMITHDGVTMCLADWVDRIGMNYNTIYNRLRNGWTVERALTTKQRALNRRHARISRKNAQKPLASLEVDPH